MIISQTPVRISLGGGGTDFPEYYENFSGFLLTASVNKYVYVLVRKNFDRGIRFTGYYHKEVVNSVQELNHPVVKATLRYLNMDDNIEIVSMSDVPANCGLGTSSSFTVGLLNALHTYCGDDIAKITLAKEAIHIERVILKEAGGIQDQYISACGGINCLDISKKGEVEVIPLKMDDLLVAKLENRLLFFYTRRQRNSCAIQEEQQDQILKGRKEILESYHRIKALGLKTKEYLETGNLDHFGRLLDEHWQCKKKYRKNITDEKIDRCYELAMRAGALGGKIIGAGGGGFLMFYSPENSIDNLRKALSSESLDEVHFRFDKSGSKILINI